MFDIVSGFDRRHLAAALSVCLFASGPLAGDSEMEVVQVWAQQLEKHGPSLDTVNGAASRLGLSLMDLPASAEIVEREEIAVKGDFSGLSAVTRAAGFSADASPGNGGTATSVRGFNGHTSLVNTYDGTRLYVGAGTVSFPADTWTVERIEVLRGPGSVINGVGAMGATVNYVPRKPTFEAISHQVAITLGENGLRRYAYGSGGELTSRLAYRLDAVSHRTDGHVDRADEERTAVAGSLLFRPAENLDVRLSVDYADTDAAPYWGTPLVDGGIPDAIRENNYNVADGRVTYEDLWPRVHLEWQLTDTVRFRSDSYYLEADRHWRNVESYSYNPETGRVDRSLYLEILHDQEQLGHRTDLLFSGTVAGMANRFNIGAEVNRIDFTHTNNSPYAGSSSVDLLDPDPGYWAEGVGSETTRDYETETLQHAVFVDNVLAITDHWKLVAGVRHDEMDYERLDLARSNGESAGEIERDIAGTSWRVGGVYRPDSDTSFYAQVSTAVDSIQSLASASNPDLDLAEGEQIEVGVKQRLLHGRLQYTLALYDIVKSNLISSEPGGVERQIGEQSSRGVELDLYWVPLEGLSVDFNLALTEPEYEEFVSAGSNFSGNVPRSVPERTANLWLTWRMTPHWSIAGGARYVGERYLDHANTSQLPDYKVYDATLSWQVNRSLALTLRGENLSDTDDYVLSPYGNQWILAEGRTVEAGLHYRF